MKNTWLIAILIITLFAGCKQDFDLTADYEETPVVYGLLNPNEQVHYIRIQKGYLIDGNAIVAGGVSDSIYYGDQLTAKLVPYQNGNQSGSAIPLQRVDGNFENPPIYKDGGTFSNQPNILYKFTGTLDQNKTYQLEVTNGENNYSFKSLRDNGQQNKNSLVNDGIGLVKNFGIVTPAFRGQQYNPSFHKAAWRYATNGALYDVKITFPYIEHNISDNSIAKRDSINIVVVQSKTYDDKLPGDVVQETFNTTAFLNALHSKLKDSTQYWREFDAARGLKFTFSAGGMELYKYMLVLQTQSSGLVANESVSPYTNMSGAYGIFSSRNSVSIDSIMLAPQWIDSLACHPLMEGANFHRANGQLCQ